MSEKRRIEVCIISDVHLGTHACHAKELNRYLKSIQPNMLIINGDWLDIWHFSAGYFPKEHIENVFLVLDFARQGIPVYYIAGNHDDTIRDFLDFKFDTIEIKDEIFLDLDGKKHWIFHGDKYDLSVGGSARWLAKLGGRSYDQIFRLNRYINKIRMKLGKDRIYLSKLIKDKVKSFVKSKVQDFEDVALEIAIKEKYDCVICGHIHKPQDRIVANSEGSVRYLNSGDWVENLTALEYNNGDWEIFYYWHDLQFKDIDRS
ncbi:MAG: UDP-2,3-diacylglucosamine diphosphatase [Chitinophagales bacterium]